MNRLVLRLRQALKAWLFARGYLVRRVTERDRRYLSTVNRAGTPLPPGAREYLRRDHPALQDLRQRYADVPMDRGGRWGAASVDRGMDLLNFRGDSLYLWHYREGEQLDRLRYYVLLRYLRDRDDAGLLDTLGEDGAFGCWTFRFDGHPVVSRDLLDSVNEILFLQRHLGVLQRPGLRVLDIGAGYGRLAHRFTAAVPGVADYCCTDGVPESTFVSEYYLRHRGSPARVVPLDRVAADLAPGSFDLAVNIHSFPEIPRAAIAWWLDQLARLRVPALLLVPNDGERLLSSEPDGSRLPFDDLLARAGYRMAVAEPAIADPAVRELTGIEDACLLFRLGDGRA
jgi:SAM-dependent methyltransferase